jgi:CRISPR-associated exonuclease Cas4
MVKRMQDDYVPLAMINALAYCPRRFVYECVQGEMLVNAHVLEGLLRHEGVDLGERTWVNDGVQERRVTVWSERLRLLGVCDVVEQHAGALYPVEYKKGKRGRWKNDQAQLCAQAMCLEERLGCAIAQGMIFYFGGKRREVVEFTPALRAEVERLAAEAHELVASGVLPPPITQRAKCRDCSLEPLCLPDEVRQLEARPSVGIDWE